MAGKLIPAPLAWTNLLFRQSGLDQPFAQKFPVFETFSKTSIHEPGGREVRHCPQDSRDLELRFLYHSKLAEAGRSSGRPPVASAYFWSSRAASEKRLSEYSPEDVARCTRGDETDPGASPCPSNQAPRLDGLAYQQVAQRDCTIGVVRVQIDRAPGMVFGKVVLAIGQKDVAQDPATTSILGIDFIRGVAIARDASFMSLGAAPKPFRTTLARAR